MSKAPTKKKKTLKKEGPPRLVGEGGWQITFDDMEDAYKVTDKAIDKLDRRGIKMSQRPLLTDSPFVDEDGFPVTPTNLMDLSNNELGELYSIVFAWKAYIVDQVAEVMIKYEEAKNHFELVSAKVRLTKADLKQQDKTAAQQTDIRYVAAKEEEFEIKAFLTLLQKAEENMETQRKTISRIISLRDQEARTGSRLAGIGARRTFSKHMPRDKDDEDVPPPELRRAPSRRPSTQDASKQGLRDKKDALPKRSFKSRRTPPKRKSSE